ncbi:MAG: hypothetical protein QGG40_16950 [Myxococcota bacterium]|nr:hypothetical protein [Myxococcota bacterium]
MNRWTRTILLATILLLTGCWDSGSSTSTGCIDEGDCSDGMACVNEECQTVDCLTSNQCGIGEFCNAKYKCLEGCEEDGDCQAGANCESGTCVEYSCRSTQLDCSIGEFCDESSGDCYEDDAPHCEECDPYATSACGSSGDCWGFYGSTCSPGGNDCPSGSTCEMYAWGVYYCLSYNCYVECNPNEDDPCPRGYQCGDVTGLGDYVCYADCAWLNENGY